MIAGQTSVGANGKQNLLFPLEYMYITQGEGGSYSHKGTYAIDFQGWGPNGRVLKCPYYAPCDLDLVAKFGTNSPLLIYQSTNEVNLINGTTSYITLGIAHDDDTPNYQVGRHVSQGQLLGHTGTYGYVTGDHVHMEIAFSRYSGMTKNPYDNYMFINENHLYNGMGVDNTVIYHNLGYSWRSFGSGPTPHQPYLSKHKFKWVLYRKKRKM